MRRCHASAVMALPAKHVPIPRNGVDYRNKVVLAPMVRSGELPSRLLALRYGADLVWGRCFSRISAKALVTHGSVGPETVDQSMIGTTRYINPHTSTIEFRRFSSNRTTDKESVIYRIHPALESRHLIFQMGTASPARAVQAARLVAADVAGIDVNAGCPKPFSVLGNMGAALLRTPDTLCSILEALVRDVGTEFAIGISVKIRLLETPEMTADLVRRLCATGITGLTVHCRTTPMRKRQKAIRDQMLMIAGICRESGVACVMNGDIENRDHALQLMKEYQVDGAMIATCAETNPSCFRSQADGGLVPWRQITAEYIQTALEVDNRWANTKFLLGNMIPGKEKAHQAVLSSVSYKQVCAILGLDGLSSLAAEVDDRLGIDEARREEAKAKRKAARLGNPSLKGPRSPKISGTMKPLNEQRRMIA